MLADPVAAVGVRIQSATVAKALSESIAKGSEALAGILAAADGFQLTAQEEVSTHHYANVLFNTLRGGIFDNQYLIASSHFRHHVEQFNGGVYDSHQALLNTLPEHVDRGDPEDHRRGDDAVESRGSGIHGS